MSLVQLIAALVGRCVLPVVEDLTRLRVEQQVDFLTRVAHRALIRDLSEDFSHDYRRSFVFFRAFRCEMHLNCLSKMGIGHDVTLLGHV